MPKFGFFGLPPVTALLLVFSIGASPAYSQQIRSVDREVEPLRQRMLELEAENTAVVDELIDIRRLPDTAWAGRGAAETVRVATAGPLAPVTPVREWEVPASVFSSPLPPQAQGTTVTAEGNGSQIGFYGFVRIDAIFDDSRPDAFQTPTYILPEPPGEPSNGNLTMHPRLSRFGMNFRAQPRQFPSHSKSTSNLWAGPAEPARPTSAA